MFLEIKGIRKSFGTGDSRVDVLKGLNLEIEKENSVYCWVRPDPESPPFSILSAESMLRMKAALLLKGNSWKI